MTLTYDEARAIAAAAKASGALKIDPAKQLLAGDTVDTSEMNKAIDALLESGQEFTVKHATLAKFSPKLIARRMCKLLARRQARLVREAPNRTDWNNPRVYARGDVPRGTSLADAGRKGGLAKKKGTA